MFKVVVLISSLNPGVVQRGCCFLFKGGSTDLYCSTGFTITVGLVGRNEKIGLGNTKVDIFSLAVYDEEGTCWKPPENPATGS